MSTWSLIGQLTSGSLAAATDNRIWWSGSSFGSNIVIGQYQDSTHLTDSTDVHLCTSHHVHNTKYLSPTTLSLDGASSANLSALTQGNTGLKFTFTNTSAVSTSSATLYAYDGTTDSNPMSGVSFKAAEGGTSTTWTDANGSGSALVLADQAPSTSHDFFVATSVSPTSNGNKVGKIKISLIYI